MKTQQLKKILYIVLVCLKFTNFSTLECEYKEFDILLTVSLSPELEQFQLILFQNYFMDYFPDDVRTNSIISKFS